MKIVFRADASRTIGTGHVMRCLALAKTLQSQGADIQFLCRRLEEDLIDWIREEHGFAVETCSATESETLPHPVDWLIVDHYGLDARWELRMRPQAKKIAVIDDLANRPHDCDLLIDQNYHPDSHRYDPLTPPECQRFLGPAYALLREEFKQARQTAHPRTGQIRRILISFGGSDPTHETEKVLNALQAVSHPLEVTVILGILHPRADSLPSEFPQFEFLRGVSNMAELLCRADLVIGAGGTSSWERCCVGAPTVVINVADNQVDLSHQLEKIGVIRNLGLSQHVQMGDIARVIDELIRNPEIVCALSEKARRLVDGQGTERVADALLFGALAAI
ncbi:MAG TPA: UDP-2,4-diacetamido-2,4,6-trideoxy-beta-L-altropyranose hydrolase [Coleofasciculaceae cyanobacterium]